MVTPHTGGDQTPQESGSGSGTQVHEGEGYASGGEGNGEPLQAVKPLPENGGSQENSDERENEVAEAGLEDVAGIHRPG